MNNTTKKDRSIALVRVISMLMIILCHILTQFNSIRFVGQVLNVGVFTFLFISGFLYGKKDIDNASNWLIKRAMRLLVPMYIFMLFLFGIRIILFKQFDTNAYLAYFFNIQGFTGRVKGAGHLWFLTAIMICYLITPLLNKIKINVRTFTKVKLTISLFTLIGIQVISSYLNETLGLYLCYTILYIFAYFFTILWDGIISKKGLVIFTLVTMIAVLLRLVAKFIVDGSILYDNVIVLYTQSVFGVWIFIFISYFKKINNNDIIIKIVNHLDAISFEIFIAHYMFIDGPLRVMSLTKYTAFNIVIFLVLAYMSGVILHKLSNLVYNIDFFKRKIYTIKQNIKS